MFSHVMIGTNDLEKARSFYDALLGTLGIPPGRVDRHRIFYRSKTGTFSVSLPIDGKPATFANGGTIGFAADSAEAADAFHAAGIAHGDLGRHSLLVDTDGRPWLVDFDHATAVAPERLRQADLVELLVSLAAIAPGALTQMTREELGDAPGLWDELARRVATPTAGRPEEQPQPDAAVRRRSSGPSR